MLKGSGWKKGQACAHSWLKNHPLGFIGRGKILAQALWPGMEARLRGSDGKLNAPSTQAVDADGFYVGRDGLPKPATLNRLRFGQDGALIEGAYTADGDSDYSDHALISNGVVVPVRTLNSSDVVDPLGTNTSTRIDLPAISTVGHYTLANTSYPGDQAALGQSVWLRGASGGETVYLTVESSGGFNLNVTTCNLTTTWQRFSVGGSTRRHAYIGIHRGDPGQEAQSAQTFYAWGLCLQNQFAFGTGTVDGDNPLTVSQDNLRYDNTGKDLSDPAEGTIFITPRPDFDAADEPGGSATVISTVVAGGGGFRLEHDDAARWTILWSGGTVINGTSGATRGIKVVLAARWTSAAQEFFVNAVSDGSRADAIDTATGSSLFVGQDRDSNQPWFGNLASMTIVAPSLSDRQIENVTAVLRRSA